MKEPSAYLGGRWVPASAAVVSVGDAGFVLGVGVAEQLRTFAGKLFRLDDHLARLAHSLEIVGLTTGMTAEQLAGTAEELVARNHPLLAPGDDLGLSIVVTPGSYADVRAARPGAAHRLPAHLSAAVPSLGREVSQRPIAGDYRRANRCRPRVGRRR